MRIYLTYLFLLGFLSLSSAQIRLDEEFPVNTFKYETTISVKHLSEETSISRLHELPQSKLLMHNGWNSVGSSYNSLPGIVASASFEKINTKDKYCSFFGSVLVNYSKGIFEVEIEAHSFDKFLSGGKPGSQRDADCLKYYQETMREFIPLITEYLSGKPAIQENHNEMLDKAANLTAEGKSLEALKIYNKVLATDPDNPLALFNKAQILFSLKKYTETLNVILRAEKGKGISDFDISTYKSMKIQVLLLTKQNDRAIAEINKALQYAESITPEKAFEADEDENGEPLLKPLEKTGLLLKCVGYLQMLNRNREALIALKKYEALIPEQNRKLFNLLFNYYCQLKSPENAERVRLLISRDDPGTDLKCKN